MAFDLVDIIFPTGAWGKVLQKWGILLCKKQIFNISKNLLLEIHKIFRI